MFLEQRRRVLLAAELAIDPRGESGGVVHGRRVCHRHVPMAVAKAWTEQSVSMDGS